MKKKAQPPGKKKFNAPKEKTTKRMSNRPRRARPPVNYADAEIEALDASELLGDATDQDVREADARLRKRLAGMMIGEGARERRRAAPRFRAPSPPLPSPSPPHVSSASPSHLSHISSASPTFPNFRLDSAHHSLSRSASAASASPSHSLSRSAPASPSHATPGSSHSIRSGSSSSGASSPSGASSASAVSPWESGNKMRMCEMVRKVYRRLEQENSNVDVTGLSSRSMCAVIRELGVSSHTRFATLGASDGRAMVSAAMLGARSCVGYERSDVASVYEQTFYSARSMLRLHPSRYALTYEYVPRRRFSNLRAIPNGTTTVLAFWRGLDDDEKRHTLRLVVECPTIRSACFLSDRLDRVSDPDAILATCRAHGRHDASVSEISVSGRSALFVHFL